MTGDLARDTTVTADPSTPGRWRLTLPDHWDYLMPSGGVVMTAALRAAEAAIADPLLRLASTTATFCTPIHATKLVADVELLRRGGATAQVRVGISHASPIEHGEGDMDNRGVLVTATFVRDRKGPDVIAHAFPDDVRSIDDALPTDDTLASNPHTRFRFYQQVETRIASGDRFWADDCVAGPARYARWMRYRVPQRDAAGRFDRLAIPPLVDTMPTALHRAIGPGTYRFYAPSLDLTTYVVDDTDREWLLVDVRLRRARGGWAVADADVWDDTGKLVAYGAQAMYVQSITGDVPVIDASRRDG
ncbi:MAG: thioesterase family protein [Proteobacteria bacterium]|nr:thioesterase family protein [Pseudomonadota bacterium]